MVRDNRSHVSKVRCKATGQTWKRSTGEPVHFLGGSTVFYQLEVAGDLTANNRWWVWVPPAGYCERGEWGICPFFWSLHKEVSCRPFGVFNVYPLQTGRHSGSEIHAWDLRRRDWLASSSDGWWIKRVIAALSHSLTECRVQVCFPRTKGRPPWRVSCLGDI